MKYLVIVSLVSFTSCDQKHFTYFNHEVETEEKCIELAVEYSKLPFVINSSCKIVSPK